jgi:hypothetical protein
MFRINIRFCLNIKALFRGVRKMANCRVLLDSGFGKEHDNIASKEMKFFEVRVIVGDRAYTDFYWLYRLCK